MVGVCVALWEGGCFVASLLAMTTLYSHHELCFIHSTKRSVVISFRYLDVVIPTSQSPLRTRQFHYPCVAVESGFGRIL